MTQNEAVKQVIEKLGGLATLGQINQNIFAIKECQWKTKTPFASIRRIVRQTSGIYRVKPGLYALEEYRSKLEANGIIEETASNRDSEDVQNFNHSYYQGILLSIGNMKRYDTFVPNQDKNRLFCNETLGNISSIEVLPPYSYDSFVRRSSTIDVVWLNARKMPHSFFEVEHSTDIQNSLLKFNDLIDFNVRMFIVASDSRIKEFRNKMSYTAFTDLRTQKRVEFLDYDSIIKQYEYLTRMQNIHVI